MPSFLSKVFGRKKDDRDSSPTNQLGPGELLGGKFEAISPNVSPNATHYLELQSDASRVPAPDTDAGRITNGEKEFGLPFFRTRSRPSSPEVKPKRLFDSLPPLSLDFDDFKDKSAYNGYIFEESNSEATFSDNVLGQKRLNPLEALILIRACSKAIISRGLETLGVMTPHWYSASPDVQRRLVSKFLTCLDLTNSTTSSTPSSPYIINFEDEVNVTRSIHDIAAVFRWGLRHVQLEGDSFGTNDGWYKAFLDAEVANGYPPKAFSEKLAPTLPTSHLDLLISTLEVFSSLAAFSESNSTSGSKLSKIFGLWLLTARRVEDKDDWRTFYARWERTARKLEHLFLARIRDQSTDQRMPTRLLELVRNYPYTQGLSSPTTDLQLLPYPQFTTTHHPALFVRVQYKVTSQKQIPKTKIHPSVLLADAFSTKVEGEFAELWAKITSAASKTGSELPLGNVLANDSLRLLSLVADTSKEEAKSPTFSLLSLSEPRLQRVASNGEASTVKPITESAPITTSTPLSPITIGSDWEQFSTSGFLNVDQSFPPLASRLFDTDVERTEPRDIPLPISRKSSRRVGRKSLEIRRSVVIAESKGDSSLEGTNPKSSPKASQDIITASQLEVIELDEAFVDFWSDTLLDPIASDWPTFVVCKFKPTLVPELTFGHGDGATKTLRWLVLEPVYIVKPLPVPTSPIPKVPISAETPVRPASPIAQSPSRRRIFNFWSVSRTSSSSSTGSQKGKKMLKTPKVGEMGELIEGDEGKKDTINVRLPSSKKFRSLDLPGIKKSMSKKSDKQEEKAKSADVIRPEFSSSVSTDVDIKTASAVAAAGIAVVETVELATEKQEPVKEVGLSTTLEPVAESSEPVPLSESTDAEKQDVPRQAEATLADVEKEDIPTLHAAVPQQDAEIVDAGALNEPTIVSVLEPTIVVDEGQVEEPSKGLPLSTDSTGPVSGFHGAELSVQQTREVGPVPVVGDADIIENPIVEEVTVASEETHASAMIGKDESGYVPEATGEELEGISEKPVLEEEVALDSFPVTETATIAKVSAETQVTDPDATINNDDFEKEVTAVEVTSDALGTLQIADEVPVPVVESVGTDHETPLSTSVTAPAPILVDERIVVQDAPPAEIYAEQDKTIEEVSTSIATEVDVPAPGDLSSSIPDDVVVIQAVEDKETVIPQEIPDQAFELGGDGDAADEVSPEVEPVVESISEEAADPKMEEVEVPEPLVDIAVGEPETLVEVSIQDLPANEPVESNTSLLATENLDAATPGSLTTERVGIVEESSAVEGQVEDSVVVNEPTPIVEEALTVELKPDVEAPVDATRSEDVLSSNEEPVLDAPPIEVEAEVSHPELTSNESSEQPLIMADAKESLTPGAAPAAEEPNQEVPALKESVVQLETAEAFVVEPQPHTEEPHQEPAIETEELHVPEPGLPVEEPVKDVFTEVVQESVILNEAPLAEEATLKDEAVLDVPEREVVPSTSEILAPEISIPEETPLEVPEQGEEFLEPTLPTVEDAVVEDGPATEAPLLAEADPPPEAESSAEDPSITTQGIAATVEEEPTDENLTTSVPEVIEATQEAIADVAEEPVPSVTAEPVLDEIPTEPTAVSEALTEPVVPEGVEDAAIIEASSVPANVEHPIDIIEEAQATVDEPALPADEFLQDNSVEVVSQEPPINLVEEPFVAEASIVAPEIPAAIGESITEEPSSAPDEPVCNAEVFTATEPSTFEEAASMPEETSPVLVEETPTLADEVPATEEGPVPIPAATVADDAPATGVEADVAPESEADAAAQTPETSSAAEFASEPNDETPEGEQNTPTVPEDVPTDTDQPILSDEVEHPATEGGIPSELAESAAGDDLPIDEPNDQTIPDAPPANTDAIPAEEESVNTDNRTPEAIELDPGIAEVPSISEKEHVEPTEDEPSSNIDTPTVTAVEPDIDPVTFVPESDGPQSAEQSERPSEAIDDHPTIPNDVPTSLEESLAIEEPSEEPAVVQAEEPELASELPNGDGQIEATDITMVAPEDDLNYGKDLQDASEPSEIGTAVEDTNNIAIEIPQDAGPVTAETQ